jgi:flagellar hook-associated protein 2
LITAKVIVSSEESSVTNDPTNLCLNQNAVDPVYEKTWLGSVATPTLGASAEYTGSTNKTFTFMAGNSGELGTDDITIRWADDENNSGEFVIEAADYDPTKEYEVFQGVTLSFAGAGDRIVTNESFTVDVHSPVFQHAQDKGLAQVERRVHEGFADLISPVTENPGDFVYRYEGVETTINLPSDASLQNLVDKINDDPNNPGIVASIIDDGSGTATRYHLALTGKDTGAEHTIEIVSNTLDKFDASDAAFEYSQRATNSMVRVDGFPADSTSYIQRSGNTVADVIDGVVLDLHNAGSSVVTISNNIDEIQSKIEQLVQSVNFVNDYIKQETKYNSETGESGIMIGNYTYDIVRNSLNDILTSSVPGLDPEDATYTHLSQIGISTDPDQDGRWVVDSTELRDALNEDLEGVAQLFVQDEDETIDGVAHQLHQKMTDLTDSKSGIANVLLQNYDGIVSEIDNKIAAEERRVAMVRQRLEEKFARLEATLGQLQGQSSYLEAQLEKMPTIGK